MHITMEINLLLLMTNTYMIIILKVNMTLNQTYFISISVNIVVVCFSKKVKMQILPHKPLLSKMSNILMLFIIFTISHGTSKMVMDFHIILQQRKLQKLIVLLPPFTQKDTEIIYILSPIIQET